MSIEILKTIRGQEERAEELKQSARSKAKQILAKAKIQGEEALERCKAQAQKEAAEEKAKAAAAARAHYEASMAEQAALCRQIEEKGKRNMEAAVRSVVGKVVNSR